MSIGCRLNKKQRQNVVIISNQLLKSSSMLLAKSEIKKQIQYFRKSLPETPTDKIKIVVIIIYGQISFQNKIFTAGRFFQPSDSNLSTLTEEKCVCLLFQKAIFQKQLSRLNFLHFKKQYLKIYFFQKVGLQLASKQMDQIVDDLDFYRSTQKNQLLSQNQQTQVPGVYILVKGIYQILSFSSNQCIGQIFQTFFGEQSCWGRCQFRLRTKNNTCKYLFLKKQTLETYLSQSKFAQLISKSRSIFQSRKLNRSKFNFYAWNTLQTRENTKMKILKIKKSIKDTQLFQKSLLSIKRIEPKWQAEKLAEQTSIKNKRNNIFKTENETERKKKNRYFSVRIPKKNSQLSQDNNLDKSYLKRHYSEQKFDTKTRLNIKGRHIQNLTLNGDDFSKFAKTTFLTQRRTQLSSFLTQKTAKTSREKTSPQRAKSHHQFTRSTTEDLVDNLHKWDIQYSKLYDRQLASSLRKQKHLSLIMSLKGKMIAKQKSSFFTFEDALQTKQLSFYQLQKRRRLEIDQKNKRSFQKVFKAKMLTTYEGKKNPPVFR